ncbi:phasin family protein [Acinetobacter larvae]|uniref:Poly(Hydroxyalcanoate) granule associated protein n=1 Tax=Acinetobacter larvae TaxID=1789224 RepID=A0A1B2LYU5_9GAMM|nr:phasin family protein [Acinetobacter larvae]AOA58132.1 hypothetical protein BFG52_07035 [Acinetobacter larvae]
MDQKINVKNISLQHAADLTEKKIKSKRKVSIRRNALDFRKYTKQIWLAGLGAFSRAEEEGNKLFDSLVKAGEEVEFSSDKAYEQSTALGHSEQQRDKEHLKEKTEKNAEHGMNHPLNRIGLVTVKDIQRLENLILQLQQKVDLLIEENHKLKSDTTEIDIK